MNHSQNLNREVLREFVVLSKKYEISGSKSDTNYEGKDPKTVCEAIFKVLLDIEKELEDVVDRLEKDCKTESFDLKTIMMYSRKIGETTFATPYYETSWIFGRARPPIPQEDAMISEDRN